MRKKTEILCLYRDGYTLRKIAEKVGISRETVRLVINGGWHPETIVARPVQIVRDRQLTSATPERCPTCGGKVYMPCVACRLEERRAAARKLS